MPSPASPKTEQFRTEIDGVSTMCCVAWAARASLRALPFLVSHQFLVRSSKKNLDFERWLKATNGRSLLLIFQVLDTALTDARSVWDSPTDPDSWHKPRKWTSLDGLSI